MPSSHHILMKDDKLNTSKMISEKSHKKKYQNLIQITQDVNESLMLDYLAKIGQMIGRCPWFQSINDEETIKNHREISKIKQMSLASLWNSTSNMLSSMSNSSLVYKDISLTQTLNSRNDPVTVDIWYQKNDTELNLDIPMKDAMESTIRRKNAILMERWFILFQK